MVGKENELELVFVKVGDKLLIDRAFEIYVVDWGMRKFSICDLEWSSEGSRSVMEVHKVFRGLRGVCVMKGPYASISFGKVTVLEGCGWPSGSVITLVFVSSSQE